MKCSKCQREIIPGQKFCNHCGQSVEDVTATPEFNPETGAVRCRACNAVLAPGVKFCKVCGTPVLSETTKKKKISPAVIILSIALAVVLIVGGIVLYLALNDELPFFESESSSVVDDEEDEEVTDKENDDNDEESPDNAEKDKVVAVGEDDPERDPEVEPEIDLPEEEMPEENDDYLFPSDRVYITAYDLEDYTRSQVALIRNEIYARHGYVFQTEPYITYFNSKSWYVPNPNFSENDFNRIELANKEFLIQYEAEKGWR